MSIFTGSKSHWYLNACVNYLHGLSGMEAACVGYHEATEVLLAEVIERGGTLDTLIYPIVFNWRHYVELRLKLIYLTGHALHEGKKAEIPGHHGLNELWGRARSYVVKQWPHSPESELKELDEHIADLARHDNNSYVFRYTLDKKGRSALPNHLTHIGTVEFREMTTRIAATLEGISLGLDVALQEYSEFLAEMG